MEHIEMDYLSKSGFLLYRRCGWAYKLAYLDRIQIDSEFLRRGREIHELVALSGESLIVKYPRIWRNWLEFKGYITTLTVEENVDRKIKVNGVEIGIKTRLDRRIKIGGCKVILEVKPQIRKEYIDELIFCWLAVGDEDYGVGVWGYEQNVFDCTAFKFDKKMLIG